jgi:hypothetical protein
MALHHMAVSGFLKKRDFNRSNDAFKSVKDHFDSWG